MNKKEIIDKVSKLSKVSKMNCELVFDNIFKVMSDYFIKENESLTITNFGTFKISKRKPRNGRNIITQEKILIKSHKTITFKISNKLKEQLNKKNVQN